MIIPWAGATHCITMQIPVGTKAKMEADPADLCGPQKLYCVSGPCGNITAAGCCQGETLKYCQFGKLLTEDCTGDPKCGWDSTQSWYDCGTAGSPDPSGTDPMSCDVITDAGVPDGPPVVPCGNVTYEGCCDGETLKYCENNQLYVVDCATQGPKCGWDSSGSYYNCGTGGTPDPSGTHPMTCAGAADAAVPDLPPPDLAQPDAPWLPDQQVQVDQPASQPDVAKTDGKVDEDGGCGCRVASAPGQPALPLLLGLALL